MKLLLIRWGLLLAGLSVAIGGGGCDKDKLVVPANFILLAAMTITPDKAEMRVGDTLWLDTNYSDSLVEYFTRKKYRIRPQNVPFRTGFAIYQLPGIGLEAVPVANTVNAVAKRGRISVGGTATGEFFLDYDGSHYRGRFGFIPSRPGITTFRFLLRQNTGSRDAVPLDFIQLPPDSQGQRQRAFLLNSYFVVNDGKRNNYDLYSRHTKAFSNDPNVQPEQLIYEMQSTFTVEVK